MAGIYFILRVARKWRISMKMAPVHEVFANILMHKRYSRGNIGNIVIGTPVRGIWTFWS